MSEISSCRSVVEVQDYLVRVWCDRLGRTSLSVLDDFFEIGGSSMQVIEMLLLVIDEFHRDIDFSEFFKKPTISNLAELISRKQC